MNKNEITIVICCAGMGTRLGIGSTKALLNIAGKSLIIRILDLLWNYDDIRIVVGYQAEKIIQEVTNYRKDIMFVFNRDFATTGVAASLKKALPCSRKYVVEIDGDLLVNSEDFNAFMECPQECLGINTIRSDNPVLVNTEGDAVVNFSLEDGNYEWTGLAKIESKKLEKDASYIYQMLQPLIPLPYVKVRARDIDTA